MTVSRDTAPARTEPAVPDQPGRRSVPSQSGAPRPVVADRPSGVEDAASVRRAVEALRRALDEGAVHHHRGPALPAGRQAPAVEVVRAWVAGHDVDEQRRACRTCAAAS